MKASKDLIAEADVYLAYGRPAQAIEILRQGMKNQPGRAGEFQAKLAEIEKNKAVVGSNIELPKLFYISMLGGFLLHIIGAFSNPWIERAGMLILFATVAGIGFRWFKYLKPP